MGARRLLTMVVTLSVTAGGQVVEMGFVKGDRCKPSMHETCGADMAQVELALTSSERLWQFVTSPQTGYFERIGAAARAWPIVSVKAIPEILRVRRELNEEGALHAFGVSPFRPDDARGSAPIGSSFREPRDRIGINGKRTIFGHEFMVPKQWIYLQTDADYVRTPWPYQVREAMNILLEGVAGHSDPAAIIPIALTLPCTDHRSASDFVWLTVNAAKAQRAVNPRVFAVWVNALRKRMLISIDIVHVFEVAESLSGTEDDSWAMLQVFGIEVASRNDWADAGLITKGIQQFRPLPNSLVLATARYLSTMGGSSGWRSVYIDIFLKAIGETPIIPPPGIYKAIISPCDVSFECWLTRNEAVFEEKAHSDRNLIERARQNIATSTLCSQ